MVKDINGKELLVGQKVVVAGRKWHYSSQLALRQGIILDITENGDYAFITIQYYCLDWSAQMSKQTLKVFIYFGTPCEKICVVENV